MVTDIAALFSQSTHKLYVGYENSGRDEHWAEFGLKFLHNWLQCLFPEQMARTGYRACKYSHSDGTYLVTHGRGYEEAQRPGDAQAFIDRNYQLTKGTQDMQLQSIVETAIANSKPPENLSHLLSDYDFKTNSFSIPHSTFKKEYESWLTAVAKNIYDSLLEKGENKRIFSDFSTDDLVRDVVEVLAERIVDSALRKRTAPHTIEGVAYDLSWSLLLPKPARVSVEIIEGNISREALERIGRTCYQNHITNADHIWGPRYDRVKRTSFRWAVNAVIPEHPK